MRSSIVIAKVIFFGWLLFISSCGTTDHTLVRKVAAGSSIGTVSMKEDGSLELMLRAESLDGLTGDALFIYKKEDAEYDKIIQHVGGLRRGQSKLVPPWNDGESGEGTTKVRQGL